MWKYVYYHCSRFDQTCKQPYVREDELLVQFLELVDEIDLDKTGMRKRLEAEVERMNKCTADVLGIQNEVKLLKMYVRWYAKYMLKNGMIEEKRDILRCLKNKISLRNGIIGLNEYNCNIMQFLISPARIYVLPSDFSERNCEKNSSISP